MPNLPDVAAGLRRALEQAKLTSLQKILAGLIPCPAGLAIDAAAGANYPATDVKITDVTSGDSISIILDKTRTTIISATVDGRMAAWEPWNQNDAAPFWIAIDSFRRRHPAIETLVNGAVSPDGEETFGRGQNQSDRLRNK